MNIQKIASDYFHFTKRERTAILVFLAILLLALSYRVSLNFYINPQLKIDLSTIELPNDSVHKASKPMSFSYESKSQASPIDPNFATFKELTAIGLTKHQAAIIINYRKKGSRYIYQEDLLKIYTLDSTKLASISHFLQLPKKPLKQAIAFEIKKKIEKKVFSPIDVNEADSFALVTINGIGPYLAHSILHYRNRLGGFISLEQMLEIKGMHIENFNSLKEKLIIQKKPKKINLNTVEIKELAKHPYSDWTIAKIVINYRLQHGKFQTIQDVYSIFGIDKAKIVKLSPYLHIE